ncbi:hypothetical protein [Pedobacter agri]|uniref:hypothetical protein n=1 Tax=Pedobacter agri TaxID=454586 RepID=UPI00292F207B|nr:hypothetical protein [Pedobacter agri]
MKRIISTLLILAGIILFHSCRAHNDQDEQATIDTKIKENKFLKSKTYKITDTVTAIGPLDSKDPKTDPPPKDRDQWKTDGRNTVGAKMQNLKVLLRHSQ